MPRDMGEILFDELRSLENIHGQNIDTGAALNDGETFISRYTNRLFGAPFQLMDSVDKRLWKQVEDGERQYVNKHLGNQYLRNIILNSPILHIKPGMPKYQGKDNDFGDLIKTVYADVAEDNGKGLDDSLLQVLKSTILSYGKKLQKRMFGFKSTYKEYMSYVNYMCRSMACFLNLTSYDENREINKDFPPGAVSNAVDDYKLDAFDKFKWENYRMITGITAQSAYSMLKEMGQATYAGAAVNYVATFFGASTDWIIHQLANSLDGITGGISEEEMTTNYQDNNDKWLESMGLAAKGFDEATQKSMLSVLDKQVSSVMFMVEPVSFSETLRNELGESQIETTIDGINQGLGQEIAFMTNSNVDPGLIGSMASLLGNAATGVADFVSGLVEPLGGGFLSNLFSGAVHALKGEKMIYPQIYKKSTSESNFSFTVNLSTPYGDVYNYYMHIVVPLMHLIALAAPKMLSANSTTSPFIVQAFIPGMCTIQMGMITNMTINKNPKGNRVSVHGYPLDIQVKFDITELYNAMAISPTTDPSSFVFNETLNDYMANLAGLVPSRDSYEKRNTNVQNQMKTYFNLDFETGEGILEDFAIKNESSIRDLFMPTYMSL